jgi:hypothetical protein
MPTLSNNAVTTSTTAIILCDGNPNRAWLAMTNGGAVTVYLGNASVSSTAFVWALAPGETVQFTAEGGDKLPQNKWYGRTASSTASVSVGESRA